jgi:hypothetical protein
MTDKQYDEKRRRAHYGEVADTDARPTDVDERPPGHIVKIGSPRPEVAEEDAMQAVGQPVDVRGLRSALDVLMKHEKLIADSMRALELPVRGSTIDAVGFVEAAIDHIVNDDFRSPETPGGS